MSRKAARLLQRMSQWTSKRH